LIGLCLLIRIYLQTGEFEKSFEAASKARELISYDAKSGNFIEIEYLYWLSSFYMGNLSIAISELKNLYFVYKKSITRFTIRKLLSSVIRGLIFLGQFDEAKVFLSDIENYGDTSSYFRMQYNYLHGIFSLSLYDLETSYNFLNGAVDIAKNYTVYPYRHRVNLTFAKVCFEMSNIAKAMEIIESIKSEVISTKDYYNVGKLYYLLASIHFIQNDTEKAKFAIEEALKHQHPELKLLILYKAIQIYKISGDPIKAKDFAKKLEKRINEYINSLYSKEDKEKFLHSHNRNKYLNEEKIESERIFDHETSISLKKFDYIKTIDLDNENTYITTLDGEKMFGVSRITIFRWIKEGKLKAIQVDNGRYKILLKDLQNYIMSQNTGRSSSLPSLQRYIEQEEKRYLKFLIDSKKTKKEISEILEITMDEFMQRMSYFNLLAYYLL
jgi:hypothetical protein